MRKSWVNHYFLEKGEKAGNDEYDLGAPNEAKVGRATPSLQNKGGRIGTNRQPQHLTTGKRLLRFMGDSPKQKCYMVKKKGRVWG